MAYETHTFTISITTDGDRYVHSAGGPISQIAFALEDAGLSGAADEWLRQIAHNATLTRRLISRQRQGTTVTVSADDPRLEAYYNGASYASLWEDDPQEAVA